MWYFVQICLALRHLHGQGILHRDLKAANIFIAAGDIVKLGDFGISKVLGSQTGFCSTVVIPEWTLSPKL
jgi:NIMA (never in mitosis gene a)-related kinase